MENKIYIITEHTALIRSPKFYLHGHNNSFNGAICFDDYEHIGHYLYMRCNDVCIGFFEDCEKVILRKH